MISDFNKLDKVRETKLVNAIQKAAALAKVSSKPQYQVLAQQLRMHGFDHRFAKVATGAYNKRKTIDHMTSNPQSTRGGSFAIVDVADVQRALGFMPKTAALDTAQGLVFKYTKQPQMAKTAAAQPSKPVLMPMQYTHDMTVQQMQQRLSYCVNKIAAYTDEHMRYIRRLVSARDAGVSKVARMLLEHPNGCQALDAAASAVGTEISELLSRHCKQVPVINKVAGYQIPDMDMHAGLMAAHALNKVVQEQLAASCDALDTMHKAASTIDQIEKHFVEKLLTQGLDKTAAGLGALVTTVPATALMSGVSTVQGSLDAASQLGPILEQALPQGGKADPNDHITPRFLVGQRRLAQTLALSDMLADRRLAKQHSVYDIVKAFNRLMQVSPQFQRPTRREALRAQIATMLAQGNQLSTADIAAARKLVQRTKDQAGIVAAIHAAQQKLQPVQYGTSTKATDVAKSILGALTNTDNSVARKMMDEFAKAMLKDKQDKDKDKDKDKDTKPKSPKGQSTEGWDDRGKRGVGGPTLGGGGGTRAGQRFGRPRGNKVPQELGTGPKPAGNLGSPQQTGKAIPTGKSGVRIHV